MAVQIIKNSKINMEGEKEIQRRETQEEEVKEGLLSEKALDDDFELNEDLDSLPI